MRKKRECKLKEIKIRPLTVKDRKKLSSLIQKLSEKVGGQSWMNLISSQVTKMKENPENDGEDTGNEDYIQIGLKVLRNVLEILEEETQEWFSDLIGVTIDEFLDLPIDTEIEIIDQIINAQEASSFFIKALQLFNRIKTYQNKQGKTKKK